MKLSKKRRLKKNRLKESDLNYNENFDFVTLGSATVDAFIYTSDNEVIKIMHPHFDSELIVYPLGTKMIINELDFQIGGGGTNSAVSLAKLGLKVSFMGTIGNDENGELVLKLLKKCNVEFIGKRKSKTGFSVILDSFVNDRTILTFKGANEFLEDSNVKTKAIYSAALTGEAFKMQLKIFKKYKRKNVIIFYNPSSYVVKQGMKILRPYLKNVNFLIFNLEEARILTNLMDVKKILKYLKKEFPKMKTIITDGANGIYFEYKNKIMHILAHKVKVVETTGAGDAFGSTFAGFYFLTKDFLKSIKIGMLNAESVIQKKGAKNGLLTKDELEEKYKKQNFKIVTL